MIITALPTPPQRSDGPETFANNGDVFIAALPVFVSEANALATQVSIDAAAVASSAPGAVAAANFKGDYSSGTTYQIGQSVAYGGNTWFAKTVNLAVTPVSGLNWQLVQSIPAQAGQTGKFLTTNGTAASWGVAVDLTTAQTLTTKTMALGSNTITGTLAQFNTAVTDADLASLATAQTLTNKTLALGSNTVSGTLAQFNAAVTDADLASLAGAETLTNKTMGTGSTWIGNAIPIASGGTGLTTPGTAGNVLMSNGTAWVSDTLPSAYGGLGTYVFARLAGAGTYYGGESISGSGLNPASLSGSGNLLYHFNTLSGTWRILGHTQNSYDATLFLRIA